MNDDLMTVPNAHSDGWKTGDEKQVKAKARGMLSIMLETPKH